MSALYDYFDRIEIIHLPERQDRHVALCRELAALGVDIVSPKVRVPPAPRPASAEGFASRAVHGNFLSHLAILRGALADGLSNVLVLEDDAIFSRRMVREQGALCQTLARQPWDLCFFGHSLKHELRGCAPGLVEHRAEFIWAHCYAVNARILPRLVDYMELTMRLEPGDPRGARMYIDAAFTLFRRQNPDVVTLVGNPVLSVQRGSPSSIAGSRGLRASKSLAPLLQMGRAARDQWWRLTA